MILCLETATSVCSVALCTAEGVISSRQNSENRSHASLLTVFIEDILSEHGVKIKDLDAVAVSKGPGSYTGLRIGVSVAKGISYRAGIPLIGIDTLLVMFHGMKKEDLRFKDKSAELIYCPMLDARRMEVYYCLFDKNGKKLSDISAEIIGENSFSGVPLEKRMIFFGDGAMKCEGKIKNGNSLFYPGFEISAEFMQKPAYEAFSEKRFEDIAYFEPFYLKDFITTTQRKNVLE
jgi:tRNA threonylcarbamoyladenosine biosynthesis protein TsaB